MANLIIIVLIVTGALINSHAEDVPTPVRAKIVSDVAKIKPGDSFNLGVLFDIDPGWHVYWKNPGSSGLPTVVDFKLPPNMGSGAINWPIPSSLINPQSGVDFGYENSLMLWTEVLVDKGAIVNSNKKIQAQVTWVSCRDICVPGRIDLAYDLKISDKTMRNGTALFSKWNDSLPTQAGQIGDSYEINLVPIVSEKNNKTVEVLFNSKSEIASVEYFPNPGDEFIVDNISQQVLTGGNTAKILFDIQAKVGTNFKDKDLDGLIVYTTRNEERLGVDIKIDFNNL